MSALLKCFSAAAGGLRRRDERRQFLILGLSKAGKTTLLYKLKLGSYWKDIQTDLEEMRRPKEEDGNKVEDAGYHYEELNFGGFWEVPGTPAMRQMWPAFYRSIKIHGIIFVVDGADKSEENIDLAKRSLHFLMNEDELRDAAIIVIINQREGKGRSQKIPDDKKAKDASEDYLHYRLGLHELHPSIEWRYRRMTFDVMGLTGEHDRKWLDVETQLKKILNNPKGFGMRLG